MSAVQLLRGLRRRHWLSLLVMVAYGAVSFALYLPVIMK